MKKGTHLVLATVAVLAIVGAGVAFYLEQRDTAPSSGQGQPLAPEVMAQINNINHIAIMSQHSSVNLLRQPDGNWSVIERHDYPAAFDKIKQILIRLGESNRTEQKTADPARYDQLGLSPEAAYRVQLHTLGAQDVPENVLLLDMWIGNTAKQRGATYVRVEGEAASWLASGNLSVTSHPADWLNASLVNIDRDRVRGVSVVHPGNQRVDVRRDSTDSRDFTLKSLPEGREILSQYALNNLSYALENLQLEDVQPKDAITFDSGKAVFTEVTTFDGIKAAIHLMQDDQEVWWATLAFSYDAMLDDAGAAAGANTADSPMQQEVEELNRRARDWVFALPAQNSRLLASTPGDVLKPLKDKTQNTATGAP